MYEIYEPDKESFEQFVSKNLKECKFTPESLKEILNEEFDNILYCDRKEIEVKRQSLSATMNAKRGASATMEKKSLYYEFTKTPIPKKIGIRFGCELETCFLLSCKNTDVLASLDAEDFKNGIALKSSGKKWQNMIVYHLRNNIIPYLSEEFLKIFRFAYIYPGYHSNLGIFIDMKNGIIVKNNLQDEGYRTLIFEPDGSIKCSAENNAGSFASKEEFYVSCEIVTPILNSVEELEILLNGLNPSANKELNGLNGLNPSANKELNGFNPLCNQSNSSMGFHINVSAYDIKGDSGPITLTRGMFAELIYDWIEYEKKNYRKLRGEGSEYAVKIQDYLNDSESITSMKSTITEKNGEKIGKSDLYEPYGIALWYITEIINSEKFLSMTHHKKNNVVEFRVFNSTTDIKQLISYTQDAIGVFKNAIQRYCDNPAETLVQIQKNNLKYKYNQLEVPFPEFNGNVWKLIEYCNSREDCKLKFGYKKKSNFFGLRSSVEVNDVWNFEEFNTVIEFDSLETSVPVYYSYIAEYNEDDNIHLTNPMEISKAEYKVLEDIYKKTNKYWQYSL
jgi:hypothetical protein